MPPQGRQLCRRRHRSPSHFPPERVQLPLRRFAPGGEKVMSLTLHQKRGLLWGLGILAAVVLMSVAWAQIGAAVGNCLSPFCICFGFFLGSFALTVVILRPRPSRVEESQPSAIAR